MLGLPGPPGPVGEPGLPGKTLLFTMKQEAVLSFHLAILNPVIENRNLELII